MSRPIEDYALIGDTRTAALVCRDGSIDWLCLPRFDSGACFARLIGGGGNGSWTLAPKGGGRVVDRRYRENSLILETIWETDGGGRVRVVDGMLPESDVPRVVRHVVGERGRVAMHTCVSLRFDYGRVVPWIRRSSGTLVACAGPDAVALYGDVGLECGDENTMTEFSIAEGHRVSFELAYFPSYEQQPGPTDVLSSLRRTDAFWREWAATCKYDGPWRPMVMRSLLTLKALNDAKTGAVLAAPTTSLPEQLGGVRNWDYRYCWLRDATFVLVALLNAGYEEEAFAWRAWLLRAVAGNPRNLQILYGLRGERRLPEFEAPWLPGYADSRPVRIGNAAAEQLQLDVYGEVADVMYQAHRAGLPPDTDEWELTKAVVEAVEERWQEPDRGLWEVRGPCRPFVHSRVLAWVALDRAISAIEKFGMEGPLDRWHALRAEIHEQVCKEGYDPKRETFTQYYGSRELDAATLLIPLVGFLKPDDPRVAGTVRAIERELLVDGFVMRYTHDSKETDGLPPGEGAFYACGFWLVDNYVLQGRRDDARKLFERLIGTANDVGLLSEEYDVHAKRLVGNFPQAFSHVGLINAAYNIGGEAKPAEQRRGEEEVPKVS
ncbi:MAG TPA: glycoside hydrolase family 15 protein [Candidatus Elarobacter sp.]|jgi:GH15 family glucan-1,4-alpha-glucosidase|nr:glycoside hydrolase family 15 protein [Candidatus Elarobacter sp.]